jgi:hypothetical protein
MEERITNQERQGEAEVRKKGKTIEQRPAGFKVATAMAVLSAVTARSLPGSSASRRNGCLHVQGRK